MANRYELIGSAISPFVRKVRVILALKGIDYDLTEISVFDPPDWFEAISPLRRIPVLRDRARGGATVPDSSVIAAYLERAHPEPALLQPDPWEAARALWIEEYMDTDFAFRMGMGVFRPRVVYPMLGKSPDEDLVRKTLSEHAPRFCAFLEDALGGRDWFVGDRMSLADIAVATQFANQRHAGEAPDAQRYPNLAAFVDRVLAAEPFAALLAQERTGLGR